MATGLIGTRGTKVGNVLKYEVDGRYTREAVTVTVPVGGLSVGAVLESTSVVGKYTLVAVATTANADGVLIDDRIEDSDTYDVGGDFVLACLVDGPATVAAEQLTYNADVNLQAEKDAVIAALQTNTGIKAATQV